MYQEMYDLIFHACIYIPVVMTPYDCELQQ
jgi:hypothetical protein